MPPFRQWIKDQGGGRAVAKLLGVSHATVSYWTRKKASPKAVLMQKIVKLAKGAVTYDDIINETKGTVAERRRSGVA